MKNTRRRQQRTSLRYTLRDRYARGELTDEEFERKLKRLLETEDVPTEKDAQQTGTQLERELE